MDQLSLSWCTAVAQSKRPPINVMTVTHGYPTMKRASYTGLRFMGEPSYLWHSRDIVAGLLVRVNDGAWHGPDGGQSLQVLVGEDGFALLLALSQCNVQRLGCNNTPVHLSYRFGCFFR